MARTLTHDIGYLGQDSFYLSRWLTDYCGIPQALSPDNQQYPLTVWKDFRVDDAIVSASSSGHHEIPFYSFFRYVALYDIRFTIGPLVYLLNLRLEVEFC